MTELSESVDHLVAYVEARSGTIPALQQVVYNIVQKATHATRQERATALQRINALLSSTPLFPAAIIAMCCGALIEQGADPAIVSTIILQHAQEGLQKASAFGLACQNEARRHSIESDLNDIDACVKQYSRYPAQGMPEEARAWFLLEPICNATLAVLMRLPQAREAIRHDPEFLADLAACPAQNAALQCLRDVLDVLEHEEMVVLHPAFKRGYRIRISGIGRNYQLHTLLADALIGDPEQGWLPGQRPDPRVVAAAKDGPFPLSKEDAADFPHAEGAFLLWNWQGLQADGTLPVGNWYSQTFEAFDVSEVTPTDIRDYRAFLQEQIPPAAPATINLRLASLRHFFMWAKEQHLIVSQPMERIRNKAISR